MKHRHRRWKKRTKNRAMRRTREGKDVPLKCNRGTHAHTHIAQSRSYIPSSFYFYIFSCFCCSLLLSSSSSSGSNSGSTISISPSSILHCRRRHRHRCCCYLAWAAISFVRCSRHIAIQKHYASKRMIVCVCERAHLYPESKKYWLSIRQRPILMSV